MKAIVSNGQFIRLEPDGAVTDPDSTYVWVDSDPPVGQPDAGVVLVAGVTIDEVQRTVTRTWTTRPKTRDELVPTEVPFGAFQAALELAGVDLAGVEAALDLLPEPQRTVAKWKWLKATKAERDDQLLRQIGYQVGKTDAEIDQVFVVAKAIWG